MNSKRHKTVTYQRREDSSSSLHCCVPMCKASARFNSVLSFHKFPKDEELQKMWVVNIRRDDLTVTNHTRVCSRHFQTTDLIEPPSPIGRRRLRSGTVPVLFPWNNFTLPVLRTGVWQGKERPDPDTAENKDPPIDVDHQDHDYCSTAEPSALNPVLNHTEDPRAEIARLQKQIEEISVKNKFGLERFAASDDDIRFYTRFATHAHLMAFWGYIESATHKMIRVTNARGKARTSEGPHTGNPTFLQPIDEFFLFMTYLSLGLMQKDLAHRFKVHQSAVSRIINTWANFLYCVLGSVGIWLSEETVKAHMPDVFKNYWDTQVVLHCAELRCQTTNSFLLQGEGRSTYKSNCAFKGLIGMAPHGAVTFVSPLYAGSISDKELLKQSGVVSLLTPTMAIMVDKDFLVEHCVPCKVYAPAALSRGAQLSVPEVREIQSVARLKVHVERLIRRVKEHKIFSTVIPLSLISSINQLYTVACLLVNYQNQPLLKDWASKPSSYSKE
ncbi:uncharacterized protein LOC113138963 [Mastacembelus armatus]|uniref:Uncharacterized LOC113138963 n=1 Tax=Mastacembelus armatus TaxID=205130 RepID=A0A3Q3RKN2_9TELE|nr:uncharacterized protein LOC113138963 [Mastacembelus armatus]